MARKIWVQMSLPFLCQKNAESMWRAIGWVCDQKSNAVIYFLKKACKWRKTRWRQSLHTRMMKRDPENHTRWKLRWRWQFAAVLNATLSFTMTVMDKVEGWNEEEWVGSYLAACMWFFTKVVLCDERRRDPPLDLQIVLGIIVEIVHWVTEDSLWEHEWIDQCCHERKFHCEGTEI